MYWLVHAKRHDNDFDVSLFLLAIVHRRPPKTKHTFVIKKMHSSQTPLDRSRFNLGKERIYLSFPPEGGRAAEAFQSRFSHTEGKIRDGYGEDGCGRKVVRTERLILTQRSPYL
jgi:hypothetical protein